MTLSALEPVASRLVRWQTPPWVAIHGFSKADYSYRWQEGAVGKKSWKITENELIQCDFFFKTIEIYSLDDPKCTRTGG